MTNCEHLTVCDLRLTTRGPLHIGSGATVAKTDYIFDEQSATVSVIEPDALFSWLCRWNLADRYERFILSGDTRMDRFLRDCRITEQEQKSLLRYRLSARDALDARHSLKELHSFVRDAAHRAYLPGSSVKGALRTVILFSMIWKEKKGSWPDEFRKDKNARQMQTLEGLYLHSLALKRDRNGARENDPVNSILRGLSVADSEPIPDAAFFLSGKSDVNVNGEEKKLPLCRECVRPGTELRCKLLLDRSVLPPDFTPDALMQMIRDFDRYYQNTYLPRFKPPCHAHPVSYQDALILGGGAGFFSKSLAYPYLGVKEGARRTEQVMTRMFPGHGHNRDCSDYAISPHMLKYGRYDGELYPYGVCGVQLV